MRQQVKNCVLSGGHEDLSSVRNSLVSDGRYCIVRTQTMCSYDDNDDPDNELEDNDRGQYGDDDQDGDGVRRVSSGGRCNASMKVYISNIEQTIALPFSV